MAAFLTNQLLAIASFDKLNVDVCLNYLSSGYMLPSLSSSLSPALFVFLSLFAFFPSTSNLIYLSRSSFLSLYLQPTQWARVFGFDFSKEVCHVSFLAKEEEDENGEGEKGNVHGDGTSTTTTTTESTHIFEAPLR